MRGGTVTDDGLERRLDRELFAILLDAVSIDAECRVLTVGPAQETGLRDLVVKTAGIPLILFELQRSILLRDGANVREAQTELALRNGFSRLTMPVTDVPLLEGWRIEIDENTIDLFHSSGDLWKRGTFPRDPHLADATTAMGRVVVLFGAELGVAEPSETLGDVYSIEERQREIRYGRRDGAIAVGIIPEVTRRA
jgi:hypothetical protein